MICLEKEKKEFQGVIMIHEKPVFSHIGMIGDSITGMREDLAFNVVPISPVFSLQDETKLALDRQQK